ncbi:MAG: Maf family protein [Clostridiales bacterium]|nr:Maf family protein [Clostridiales bacterium]
MRIILGSASPRRKELLERMGLEFEVIPSKGEEIITKEAPPDIVTELAGQKAEAVARTMTEDDMLIIGADTIVAYEHQILGKPADEEDAFRMLRHLSGNTHQVYTGVCLIRINSEGYEEYCFYEKTDVTFYFMTDQEIRAYIRTGDPMDKAGAYGIQGVCGKYIREIQGDYNNVVGLPIARLYQEMKKHGFLP